MTIALQDMAHPDGICFGCGSSNKDGLQLKSYWHDDGIHVICRYHPSKQFSGWPGLVYGGLLAMLIDCHSNWTAMAYQYRTEGRQVNSLPRIDCVTGHLGIDYLKPTPMDVELLLKARVEGEVTRKSRIVCEVWADSVMTARADSIFVRVDTERLTSQAHGASNMLATS